jgi:hypothetical protein
VGFVVDKVALGQVFFEYFSFLCQFSFHRLLHIHHLSSGAGTIGQFVASVPSGLSLTSPKEIKTKLIKLKQKKCVFWLGKLTLSCESASSLSERDETLLRVLPHAMINCVLEYGKQTFPKAFFHCCIDHSF